MPNTSKPLSVEANRARARICGFAFALLLVGSFLITFSTVSQASGAALAQSHVITIETMQFSPAKLRIRPGDRVTFRNADLVPHTATSRQSDGFDSGAIKPGGSWTVQPKGGETIRYACTFHPTMTGEIVADDPSAEPVEPRAGKATPTSPAQR